jgi:hypothetical protein
MRAAFRIFRLAVLMLVGAACGLDYANRITRPRVTVETRQEIFVPLGAFSGLAAELLLRWSGKKPQSLE